MHSAACCACCACCVAPGIEREPSTELERRSYPTPHSGAATFVPVSLGVSGAAYAASLRGHACRVACRGGPPMPLLESRSPSTSSSDDKPSTSPASITRRQSASSWTPDSGRARCAPCCSSPRLLEPVPASGHPRDRQSQSEAPKRRRLGRQSQAVSRATRRAAHRR
jgi:hypothetical protein